MTAPAPVLSSVPQPSEASLVFGTLYDGHEGMNERRTFGPDGKTAAAIKLRKEAARLRDFVPVKNGGCDEARIQRFVDGCNGAHLGAFFGVALRSQESLKDRKGDAAHCQTLTSLFVDADFCHLGEDETRKRIAAAPLPPSMVVESGGGLHAYWILAQPFYLKKKCPQRNAGCVTLQRLLRMSLMNRSANQCGCYAFRARKISSTTHPDR